MYWKEDNSNSKRIQETEELTLLMCTPITEEEAQELKRKWKKEDQLKRENKQERIEELS